MKIKFLEFYYFCLHIFFCALSVIVFQQSSKYQPSTNFNHGFFSVSFSFVQFWFRLDLMLRGRILFYVVFFYDFLMLLFGLFSLDFSYRFFFVCMCFYFSLSFSFDIATFTVNKLFSLSIFYHFFLFSSSNTLHSVLCSDCLFDFHWSLRIYPIELEFIYSTYTQTQMGMYIFCRFSSVFRSRSFRSCPLLLLFSFAFSFLLSLHQSLSPSLFRFLLHDIQFILYTQSIVDGTRCIEKIIMHTIEKYVFS